MSNRGTVCKNKCNRVETEQIILHEGEIHVQTFGKCPRDHKGINGKGTETQQGKSVRAGFDGDWLRGPKTAVVSGRAATIKRYNLRR